MEAPGWCGTGAPSRGSRRDELHHAPRLLRPIRRPSTAGGAHRGARRDLLGGGEKSMDRRCPGDVRRARRCGQGGDPQRGGRRVRGWQIRDDEVQGLRRALPTRRRDVLPHRIARGGGRTRTPAGRRAARVQAPRRRQRRPAVQAAHRRRVDPGQRQRVDGRIRRIRRLLGAPPRPPRQHVRADARYQDVRAVRTL